MCITLPLFSTPFLAIASGVYGPGDDKISWLAVIFYQTMSLKALISAGVSLTKMSRYYKQYQAGMKPSAKASMQYMLMTMLGKHKDAKSVLRDYVLQFNSL